MTLEEFFIECGKHKCELHNTEFNPTFNSFKLEFLTPTLRYEIDKIEIDLKNEKILLIHLDTKE